MTILLDDDRPEYLGGQFSSTVVSSLDYERLAEFVRTGRTIPERPARFHRAIESVTAQDIAVFFQEALAELPDLAAGLAARRARARRGLRRRPLADRGGPPVRGHDAGRGRVRAGLRRPGVAPRRRGGSRRPDLDREPRPGRSPVRAEFDLVYFQDALHELPDPVGALRSAWGRVRPGGRLVVLDWCLPSTIEESRSLHGAMLWGIQLDELYQGTRMWDLAGYLGLFEAAGIPAPSVIELPSGATVFARTLAG